VKVRKGYVANSSSSSFVVCKKDISDLQISLIYNHIQEGPKYGIVDSYEWGISETEDTIEGYTDMDNFNMREFMYRIGIDLSKVQFDTDNGWDLYDEDI
jgi:hypothetical protein